MMAFLNQKKFAQAPQWKSLLSLSDGTCEKKKPSRKLFVKLPSSIDSCIWKIRFWKLQGYSLENLQKTKDKNSYTQDIFISKILREATNKHRLYCRIGSKKFRPA